MSSNGPKAKAENHVAHVYSWNFCRPGHLPSVVGQLTLLGNHLTLNQQELHVPRQPLLFGWASELPGPYQIQTTWCGSSWKTLPPLSARGPRCRSPQHPQLSCKAKKQVFWGESLLNHWIQPPRKANATKKSILSRMWAATAPSRCMHSKRINRGCCSLRQSQWWVMHADGWKPAVSTLNK